MGYPAKVIRKTFIAGLILTATFWYVVLLNDRTSKLSSCRKANVKPMVSWVIDFFSLFLRPASRTRVLPILRPAGRTEYRQNATFRRRLYIIFGIKVGGTSYFLKAKKSKRKVTEK